MAYDAAVKRSGTGAGEPPPATMASNRLFSRSKPTKGEGGRAGEKEKRRRMYSGETPVAAAANQLFDRERMGGGYHFAKSASSGIEVLEGWFLVGCYSEGRASYQGVSATPGSCGGGREATSPHDNATSQPGSGLEQSGPVWHLYDLRCGRTSVVVEGVDWAQDGRWLTIGTRNRTVHAVWRQVGCEELFGREGDECTRWSYYTNQDGSNRLALEHHPSSIAPLAYIFLNPSDVTIPPSLLPSLPTVVDPISSPLSPRCVQDCSRNYQDVLIFDSAGVVLSRRRLAVEKHPTEPNLPSIVAQASVSAATNISFPGMGDAGRLSVSPSSAGASASTRPSTLTKMMDTPEIELSAQERFVATWNWQGRRDWGEIKKHLLENQRMRDWGRLAENLVQLLSPTCSWLSQAERTTFSKSRRILPRSLCPSHQFFSIPWEKTTMPSFDDTSLTSVVTKLGSARKLKLTLSLLPSRKAVPENRS
ncbi:hypothetical protein K443DRAFT_13452 [Laccaria amethystina LaAM-08-1]|uniref:Uncharacterized protein n=1 Tax=Laccaria amethystina LaAM-08-1 TaxID=1095629 RepID=A0A0C9WVD2_9AGAR|nr:hypothetical protein K443DRAFT_13452 [Laccaria amethystina LaAM-08-1]